MSEQERITDFLEQWPDAEFGPAHIVLSDGNTETNHILWCLEHWAEYTGTHDPQELKATWQFLCNELALRGERTAAILAEMVGSFAATPEH